LGRAVLKEIFKSQGFSKIEEAVNGKDGLEKLLVFHPDLIITDMMMPEMDGFEFCKRIRTHPDPQISGLPILVQTGMTQMGDKARVFAAGATDYIVKPIDPHEITARGIIHLEREVMIRRLRDFNKRVSEELDTARITQRVLIPTAETIDKTGKDYHLDIQGYYQPCNELAGDFWGFKSISSDKLALYMVDFTGHGVNAALNVFRLHALMHSTLNVAHAPGAYLTQLNAILTPLLSEGQFATMLYGVIDTRQHKFLYASAAAPAPVVFSRCRGRRDILDNSGMLLGIDPKASYVTRECLFEEEDCLLFFSDALIETEDKNGKMLSVEHTADIFGSALHKSKSCQQSFEALLTYFNTHYLSRLSDDLTLSAFYRLPKK
jgi:sigma-B regulation protein RsbU (phosphoserine phosphatase)